MTTPTVTPVQPTAITAHPASAIRKDDVPTLDPRATVSNDDVCMDQPFDGFGFQNFA